MNLALMQTGYCKLNLPKHYASAAVRADADLGSMIQKLGYL